tara:strand:- start:2538 stop:2717 length:180 start_codon:yes stop_codon:yes gene_type:complete
MYQSQELLKVNYKCSANFKQPAHHGFVSAFSGARVYHTLIYLALRNVKEGAKLSKCCKL